MSTMARTTQVSMSWVLLLSFLSSLHSSSGQLPSLPSMAGRGHGADELEALLEMKEAMDPAGKVLLSWVRNAKGAKEALPHCGGFEGVSCDAGGRVVSVSLQGRGLAGTIPGETLSRLPALTGLYLHYNRLTGPIPPALANLTELTDLYLNVNVLSGGIPSQLGLLTSLQISENPHLALTGLYLHNNRLMGHIPPTLTNLTKLTDLYLKDNALSGGIPSQFGLLTSLQTLQLCCNSLEGEVPPELGLLKSLRVMSLHHNNLTGVIPIDFGLLSSLARLDLSFNRLSGAIPTTLSRLQELTVMDVRSNNLSGMIPPGLEHLRQGFSYYNNSFLCGEGFVGLQSCGPSSVYVKPDPLGSKPPNVGVLMVPPSFSGADTGAQIKHASEVSWVGIWCGAAASVVGCLMVSLLAFVFFRRHKQQISSAHEVFESRTFGHPPLYEKGFDPFRKCTSSLGDCRYPSHRASRSFGSCSGSSMLASNIHILQYDLEEIEFATNFFSVKSILGRKKHSAVYKGILKDGTVVAIRSLCKGSFERAKTDLKEAIEKVAQMRHDNLVALRGFCFSSGREGCLVVSDFIPGGTLQEHLNKASGRSSSSSSSSSPLDWSTRARIAIGIARGLDFMHNGMDEKVIHSNVSAGNVLLDQNLNAFLSDAGLTKLLADDIIFSIVKTSAASGYLAPEYASTGGRLNEKTDVYAFGVILMQLLSGKKPMFWEEDEEEGREREREREEKEKEQSKRAGAVDIVSWMRSSLAHDDGCLEKVMDTKLGRRYSVAGATQMVIAALSCTNEEASQRPTMSEVVRILEKVAIETDLLNAGGEGATTPLEDIGFSSSGEDSATTRTQEALFAKRLNGGR